LPDFTEFDLRPSSLAALQAMGITTPTPIQEQAIPELLEGVDVIGQAQTGSGKTLAFGLPLTEICDETVDAVQALVLVPTRELAVQVAGVLRSLGEPAGLKLALLYGGVGIHPQIDALRAGVQIVVGTPGRVLDHLQRRTLDLSGVVFLVLDEADQMLDRGFAPDVDRILALTPRDRQTALFSATTPEWVRRVAAVHLQQPIYLKVESSESEPNIEHTVIECWDGEKMTALTALLNQPTMGSTLVFGRTRRGVTHLASRLRQRGFRIEALQGDLGQAARERIVERFRDGRLPILLATNVAARGLDMLNIDRVINYDLPETSELFVHRVGRTARMGRFGQAITLVSATDLMMLHDIERHLGRKLPRMSLQQVLARSSVAMPAPAAGSASVQEIRPDADVAAPAAMPAPAKKRRRRRRPATAALEAAAS
jgi:ATP-dependent RNA helicase DeaD